MLLIYFLALHEGGTLDGFVKEGNISTTRNLGLPHGWTYIQHENHSLLAHLSVCKEVTASSPSQCTFLKSRGAN